MLTYKKANNKVILKKAAVLFFASVFCLGLFYFVFSPLIIYSSSEATAAGGSVSIVKKMLEPLTSVFPFSAPFAFAATVSPQAATTTATVSVLKEIIITSGGNVTVGNIYGITGNYGAPVVGTATFTITTNSATGFQMTVQASSTPALSSSGYYFADYSKIAPTTVSYTWTSPALGTTAFGFSLLAGTAADEYGMFQQSGSVCNAGSGTVSSDAHCWSGFTGSTAVTVINRTSATGGAGEAEKITFSAEYRGNPGTTILGSGTYTATITATATAN